MCLCNYTVLLKPYIKLDRPNRLINKTIKKQCFRGKNTTVIHQNKLIRYPPVMTYNLN